MVIMEQLHDMPSVLLKVLKCLKFLSTDAMTLDPLQRAGLIPKLVSCLNYRTGPYVVEMQSQVRRARRWVWAVTQGGTAQILNALFNMCRLHRTRQEQAALAGIVPHLKAIIVANRYCSPSLGSRSSAWLNSACSPLKQLAIPILCELSHASKPAQRELARCEVQQFYVDLLKQDYWGVTALEALAVWLAADVRKSDKVEQTLAKPASIKNLIALFESEQTRFYYLLSVLMKIVTVSDVINQQLGISGFVPVLLDRLAAETNPSVRILHLKLLLALYEQHRRPKEMIAMHDLIHVMEGMRNDKVVMLSDLARKLLDAFHAVQVV
jgi:hypothetical protein